MDAQDKSATFTSFCLVSLHEKQIPASKTPVSPRAHEQGLVPLGLPYRSVDRSQKKKKKKNSISKGWGIQRVFLFSPETWTKQAVTQAALQTLVALGVPEGWSVLSTHKSAAKTAPAPQYKTKELQSQQQSKIKVSGKQRVFDFSSAAAKTRRWSRNSQTNKK